jgi:hypothetical protein
MAYPTLFGFPPLGFGVEHVKVLVASSNGKLYAVGQAFLRNAAQGSATASQAGLSLRHAKPPPRRSGLPFTTQSGHPHETAFALVLNPDVEFGPSHP